MWQTRVKMLAQQENEKSAIALFAKYQIDPTVESIDHLMWLRIEQSTTVKEDFKSFLRW